MKDFFKKLNQEIASIDPVDLTLILTVILFLSRGFGGAEILSVTIACLSIAMLCSKTALRNHLAWFSIFLCGIIYLGLGREEADNHKYLMTYWALACGLSITERNARELLSWNGRLLIALAFTFAMLWKLLPGEIIDGSFFQLTYLQDPRFQAFAAVTGGLSKLDFQNNSEIYRMFTRIPGADMSAKLITSEGLRIAALCSSYWVLFIEGAIALTFILFWVKRLDAWRNAVLLVFVGTTYFLAPVDRFGMILTILGLAQCDIARPKTRLAFFYVFLLLQFTRFMGDFNDMVLAYWWA